MHSKQCSTLQLNKPHKETLPMTKEITVEICCGSLDDVREAHKAGIKRVEYTSAMFLGGLTPSIGQILLAKQLNISIMAMVRPREGGFCYTDAQYETMLCDASQLVEAGVDGIVFGFLNPDGTIDTDRCHEMLQIIGTKQSVFHRAFDVVPDWTRALDSLIELGVTRVLSSGQRPSALEGAKTLKAMITHTDGNIEILPGGGIRPHNVEQLVSETGCTQVHASMNKLCVDSSTQHNPDIGFGASALAAETEYKMTNVETARELLEMINQSAPPS